jgi:hypothetical protein
MRLKKNTLLAACLATIAFASGVHAGELVIDKFASAALGRDVSFTAYLPDGYKESTLRYPVTYLLQGADVDRLRRP